MNTRAVTKNHFYKEFPKGWEVEWKGNLLTKDPFGFIYDIYNAMTKHQFGDYQLPKVLGSLPVQIRCFDYLFHFYGHSENGQWVEDFVLAQPPGGDFIVPRIKLKEKITLPFNHDPSIIIRVEQVKEDLRNRFSLSDQKVFISKFEKQHKIKVKKVGTIRRERYSFYSENSKTHRNWGIIADLCTLQNQSQKKQLSQVEFEYKGINTIPKHDLMAQKDALEEMSNLGKQLITFIGKDKLKATDLTKFNWMIQETSLYRSN